MLFMCSLRSLQLPSSQPIYCPATPTLLPQIERRCWCWINFKLRRVIDYERYGKGYGKVEQRRHLQPRLIGDWMASPIAVQRTRRLFGTRTGVRVHVAESCAKRPTASRWWTRRSLKWCMSKLGKFSLQVTTVLWMLFRTRLTEKTPVPESKIRPIGPA